MTMNNNVYDLIAEFYGNSSGWDEWLSQRYAETFIRLEAYRGQSEADLYDSWSAIVTLLVYCGNVYIKIGDMRSDDFTDCIAWCSRNIGDFEPGYESVSKLLTVWSRLLRFLKQRHAITDDTGADKCRALILDDRRHKLLIQEDDGSIREDLLPHRLQPDTDLKSKVFIDMDNYLEDLLDDMEEYYRNPTFRPELDTATAYCFGLAYDLRDFQHVEGTKEEDALWEYFFFDYHLLSNGKRPVEFFAEQYRPEPDEDPGRTKAVRDTLDSLLSARFVLLWDVRKDKENYGWYYCKDFLSGDILYLSLPIDDDFDTQDVLFAGHAMDNGNMVFSYLRGLKITRGAAVRIKYICGQLQQWCAIAHPEQKDIEAFLRAHAGVVQIAAARFSMPDDTVYSFPYATEIASYERHRPAEEGDVDNALDVLCDMTSFGVANAERVKDLWNDFLATDGARENFRPDASPEELFSWALAALIAYTDLNDMTEFPIPARSATFRVAPETIRRRRDLIRESLRIEPFDPRYVSDAGLITMVLKI